MAAFRTDGFTASSCCDADMCHWAGTGWHVTLETLNPHYGLKQYWIHGLVKPVDAHPKVNTPLAAFQYNYASFYK